MPRLRPRLAMSSMAPSRRAVSADARCGISTSASSMTTCRVSRFAHVQPFCECRGERSCFGLAHVRQVEDCGDAIVDDQIGEELACGRLQWNVAVVAAEDDE